MAILRHKLNPESIKEKRDNIFIQKQLPLYFSGFCITDNYNFSEFFLSDIPEEMKNFTPIRKFEFKEETLMYQIGDHPKIIIDEEQNRVVFDNFFVDKEYFLYFTNKYPNANFLWLKSFLKEPILGLVGVLVGTKLVGLLKTKTNERG